MLLEIIKNENGFLAEIEFNKKTLEALPVYTDCQAQALVIYPSFYSVLKYQLSNFDFHECEILELQTPESMTLKQKASHYLKLAGFTRELEKKAWAFRDECEHVRKLKHVNLIRSEIMQHQNKLIEFFNSAKFKGDGSLSKRYKVVYDELVGSIKCHIIKQWTGDNLWLEFRSGGFSHTVCVTFDETQRVESLPKITLSQYKSALAKIEKNTAKIAELESFNSKLKYNMYL